MKPPYLGDRQPELSALIQQIARTEPDPRIVRAQIAMLHADYDAALDILSGIADCPYAASLIGDTLARSGRLPEAVAHLERMYDQPMGTFRRTCLALRLGRYRNAYLPLRSRPLPYDFPWPRAFSLDDTAGRDLFVTAEQGLGDVLMFARYIEPLRQHAARVAWEAPAPLVRFMDGLNPAAPHYVGPPRGAVWCAIMDVMEIFDVTPETVPSGPYLTVPPEVVAARRLPPTGKMRVGLCWAGACRRPDPVAWEADIIRSMPPEFLAPLMGVAGVEFLSLMQPGLHRAGPLPVECVVGADFDMADTAAVVAQLDLVISVDTAIAHLAGAMGKTVWMLNRAAGCWRWGWAGTETTPWYSTMRIFPQQRSYEWQPVIDQVRAELVAMT